MIGEKIEKMKMGGAILSEVLFECLKFTKPGISELEIDNLAETLIRQKGGESGFKKVPGYNHTICISTNNVVVHGIPTYRVIAEGDIVGIDCGVYFEGYHTDMAETRRVSNQKSKIKNQNHKEVDGFLEVGRKALFVGIKEARAGNRVGHISKAIQDIVEGAGFSIVRQLVGHGVGKKLHEFPEIPGYLSGKIESTPVLIAGQTIAVEVIYNMGRPDVVLSKEDNWTISSADGSPSGLFERTILVGARGPKFLTTLPQDKL